MTPGAQTRWDGRTWTVRVAFALVLVVTAATAGVDRGELIAVAVVAGLVWVPLVSLTEPLRLRVGTPWARAVVGLVDLLALVAVASSSPTELAVPAAVLTVPTVLLHGLTQQRWARAATAVAAVTAQALLLWMAPGSDAVAVLLSLDLAGLGVAWLVVRDRDRAVRRSSAALRRAGELTDAVLEGIGEAVVVTDRTGAIRSANEAAEVTFGGPVDGRCEVALGLHRGAGTLDCSRGCPLVDPTSGTGQHDVFRQHPSGTRQTLLVNVRALSDPLGRVRQVVHSYRDVTRIKQADQAKTLFLATASHELKTPLAVITGFANLLGNDSLDDERRQQALRTIRSRSEQLSSIIDRLLLASRIDGGGVDIDVQPLDAIGITTERVEALREVTDREIRLTVPEAAPSVMGDTTAIATVVDHLVENALKYSPDGGDVTVQLTVTERTLHVDVSDEGVGMAADHVEHCFEPFWQAESADTRRFGGSGVGLYIVRSLSRAMGGETVVLRSAPGAGTTFRFSLLRADAAAAAADRDGQATMSGTMIDEFMRQVGVLEEG